MCRRFGFPTNLQDINDAELSQAVNPGSAIKARAIVEVNAVFLLICILYALSFNISGGAF